MADGLCVAALIAAFVGAVMFVMNKTSVSVIKNCPCKKIIQSGFVAKFFAYFGSACFMYSVLMMGFGVYGGREITIFACSLLLGFFSFALKA